MKVSKEEAAPRQVELTIELEPEDMEPYLDRSYRRIVNKVLIPGFRVGKAPRWRVENEVGRDALVREGLEFILQESLDLAVKGEELEPFSEPDVELLGTDPVSFKAVVPLEPVVELGDFRSLRLAPEPVVVAEEEVDHVLERLRYEAAPWQPADRQVNFGDLITLDVEGTIEGRRIASDKGVDFVPDQDNTLPLPGFSVYLEGLARDETKEFTLQVPEDYADTTLAGKECRFKVLVHAIKEKALPELDDEFAKGVGTGYDNLEALRTSILGDLNERAERASQRSLQDKSLEALIEGASVEVSELTTDREIDHLLEDRAREERGARVDIEEYLQSAGKTREELIEELRPQAEERLTRMLVLRKLAQDEGLEVLPEDIDAEVGRLSDASGDSAQSIRQAFSSEGARSSLGSALLTRKVLERLAIIVQGEAEEPESATADVDEDEPEVEERGNEDDTDEASQAVETQAVDSPSGEEGGEAHDNEAP